MAQQKYLIQVVCGANYERSPFAAQVLRNEAKKEGLENHFDITSSGTKVSQILAGDLSFDFKKSMILQAHRRGILTPDQDRLYRSFFDEKTWQLIHPEIASVEKLYALDVASKNHLDYLIASSIHYFRNEAFDNRVAALESRGLDPLKNHIPHQFEVQASQSLILAIDSDTVREVRSSIHAPNDSLALCQLLAYYTPMPDVELPNTFGKGKKAFDEFAERIDVLIPAAFRSIVNVFMVDRDGGQ